MGETLEEAKPTEAGDGQDTSVYQLTARDNNSYLKAPKMPF